MSNSVYTTMESLLDSSNPLTDKNTVHSYLPEYEKLLSHKKESAANILEIGINQGGSIKLWADYFTNAQVYGLDVEKTPEWLKVYNRVTTFQQNAYDQNFIKSHFIDKNIKFDIIIDDGPHTLEAMNFAAANYTKLLTENGIIIIEDIRDWSWVKIIRQNFPNDINGIINATDLTRCKNRLDDIFISFQRKT